MTVKTFFDKFDELWEASNSVAKIRELVLRLAVQGRLVKPDREGEPVSEFLQRIWTEKADNRQEFAEAERSQPFQLPSHWRWVVLGDIADFSIGKTPPRGDSTYWYPEEHSWVSIADMKHYGTITETKEKVSSLAAQRVFRQRFVEPGSILMSFKLTIGKVALAGIRCFHNEAIISLKPPEPELAAYLFRFLPIFAALQTSNNAIKGSTLNKGLLTMLPVALPPLAEQKRIVAKVDELMALCDHLETQQIIRETRHAAIAGASLARFADAPTPANLELLFHKSYTITPTELRKSILTLAVQGKIVRQDPNDCYARHEAVSEVDSTLFVDAKDYPWEVPASWSWVRLPAACHTITDGEHITPAYSMEGVPMLSARHIGTRGLIWDNFKFVSNEVAQKCWSRCKPNKGDILVVSRGGGIGRTVISDRNDYCLMGSVLLFKTNRNVDSRFLNLYFNSKYGNEKLRTTSGSSAQQAIYIAHLRRDYLLPLPPFAEQLRIVDKVDQLMALIDQLESLVTSSHATAGQLMEAIVAELISQTYRTGEKGALSSNLEVICAE